MRNITKNTNQDLEFFAAAFLELFPSLLEKAAVFGIHSQIKLAL